MSTKDLYIFDSTGVFVMDLTGSGYSEGPANGTSRQ